MAPERKEFVMLGSLLENDCSIKNIFHEKEKPVKLNYTFVILD